MRLPHRVSKLFSFTYTQRWAYETSASAPLGESRSILRLPDELLWVVLEDLLPSLGSDLAHYKLEVPSELLWLRLTCRRFRDVITPLAFRRVKLLWNQQGKIGTPLSQPFLTFSTLATENPALLDGIRLLFLDFGSTSREHRAEMTRFLVEALPKMRSLRYLHCTIKSGIQLTEEIRRAISKRAQDGLQTLVLRHLVFTGAGLPFGTLPHIEMLRLELLHSRLPWSMRLDGVPNLRYLAILIEDNPGLSWAEDPLIEALPSLPWQRLVELDVEQVNKAGIQGSTGDAVLRALSVGYKAISRSSSTPLTDLRVSVPFTSPKELAVFVGQFKRQSLRSLNLVGTLINLDSLDTIIDTFPSITDLSFTIEVNSRSNDFLETLLTKILNLPSLCRLHCDFKGRQLDSRLSDTGRSFVQQLTSLLSPDRHLQIILSDGVFHYSAVVTYTLCNSYANEGDGLWYRESVDYERSGYHRVPTPAWRAPPVGC